MPAERPISTYVPPETCILVGIDTGAGDWTVDSSLDELGRLAETAGAVPVGRLTQRLDHPSPKTFLGSGKVQELKEIIDREELNVDIQVDGGINDSTMETAMRAGANFLVAGSYVFNGDLESNVQRIQQKMQDISEKLN